MQMCVLAGCDFVKGLSGIGIKKAHQQMRQRKSFLKVCEHGGVRLWLAAVLPRAQLQPRLPHTPHIAAGHQEPAL